MPTSIKLSELTRLQPANLTDTDLFLVTDQETNASMALTYKVLREKLLTSLQETVTALQAEVDSNENQVYEVITQLQQDVDANEVASFNARSTETLNREQAVAALQALIDALQTEAASRNTRIEALESDPTTKTYVDEQIAALVDGAPEVLNTLNELSEALGGDSNLAGTLTNSISTLQAALDAEATRALDAEAAIQADVDQNEADAEAAIAAEATARQNADTALDTRLTSLEGVVDGLDIDISPETLNSINELAAAIGDDADFVGTINTSIAAVQADVDQNEADADAALAAEEAARLLRQQREDEATIQLIQAFDGERLSVLDLSVG
jgi:small-conductance mechanosensitive channel